MSMTKPDPTEGLSRRNAMVALLGGGAAVALGCGGSSSSSGGDAAVRDAAAGSGSGKGTQGETDSASSSDVSTGDAGTCQVTPEGEIGPYFADDSAAGFHRSDILSNLDGTSTQTGVPLTLTIAVLDAKQKCAPYVGAQIDIWHCNAAGVYSDISAEGTSSEQWLRGYQITDATGRVTFKTIIPGWYSGRTTHIHLRIRSSYSNASSTSDGTNTTQCFFPQTFVDTLDTTVAPYMSEGKNPTTNDGDRVYSQQENGANLLALVGDNANGYTAFVTIFLPITAASDASAGGGGAGGPPMGAPPSLGDGG
jgi:protocatechuate 3,4-dioxygenase beta subunit